MFEIDNKWKIIHWMKSCEKSEFYIETRCGRKITTWEDDPCHNVTQNVLDLTCPECIDIAIVYLSELSKAKR